MKTQYDDVSRMDLSKYAYTSSLATVESAAADGTLAQIPGYADVKHWSVFGFDLLEGRFVEGANDPKALEDKLIEAFGSDYSLRYTILEFAQKVS